ncbi:MAG: cytochrome B [Rhodobacterales bacterium]|nr:MAG: cytochrome B [Rhodobacterales bacterium]
MPPGSPTPTPRRRSRNAPGRYGLTSLGFHWVLAVTVLSTAGVGIWLMGLGYYDPWAPTALWLHRALGVLAFTLLLLKLMWQRFQHKPPLEKGLTRFERGAAVAGHHLLNLMVFVLPVTGYLMSTTTGDAVPLVFGLEIPASVQVTGPLKEALPGLHAAMGFGILGLAAIHAAAAFKHQFFDRGHTLQRMLPGRKPLE